MIYGTMTIVSRCGKLDIPIRKMRLERGRLIFEGSIQLSEDYESDEWSRAVIFGLDGIEYGNFPFGSSTLRPGERLIEDRAGALVTVTLPTGIVFVEDTVGGP